jgi:hypothetical protein
MSLGVYVLGAADARERLRLEAHLPRCESCQAELARLTPLPTLLDQVPVSMLALPQPERHAEGPRGTVTRPAETGRRNRPTPALRLAAVAASAAAVAGGAGGYWLAHPGTAAVSAAAIVLRGANRATHVTATAALTGTSWGTSIELRLSGVPVNVQCRLIVRSRSGATEISGVWDAWGDGPISVPASAAWRPSDIASLQVTTATRSLVTISSTRKPATAATRPAPPPDSDSPAARRG